MRSRPSVPRLCFDLLDSPPRSLSPSNTFDLRDILSRVRLFPKLLAEHLAFDDVDETLYLDNGFLQDVPPFPIGRQPPLFILNSHRTRLPFPIRSDAIALDDFCWDEEDVCPLVTIPTIPRMKLMIREQLYVQKWADNLTLDNPPKHIPWMCDQPATGRRWTAEGTILPAATIKPSEVPHLEGSCTSLEACVSVQPSTESHMSTSCVPFSMDVDHRIFGEKPSTPSSLLRITTALQALSPSIMVPSDPKIVTTSNTPNAVLATRRGRLLTGLKLKRSIIEQLEYPDIPTAFRGSPSGWPSQSDVFQAPSFTDHQSMLLDLKSKCAALGNRAPTYIQESPCPQTEATPPSNADEWVFTRGLLASDKFSGSTDSQASREVVANANMFSPGDCSTPAKAPSVTARFGFPPRLPSTPVQSYVNHCSDPPGIPLPPRPALINPSTPPYVRGILKKVKSVRFDDMIAREFSHRAPVGPPSPELPSPQTFAASSERPCTPMQSPSKPPDGPTPLPVLAKNTQEGNPAARSRLPPQANGKLDPAHPGVGKSEALRPNSAPNMIDRPCRTTRLKGKTKPPVAPRPQAKEKVLTVNETNLTRGIEGPTKSRLSTPLRNIFRFR